MIEAEFDYNQEITVIQAKLDEPFKDVINKYLQKMPVNPNNAFFITNGRQINPEEKVEKQICQMDKKNKKLKILVQIIERTTIQQEFEKSKDIICPECQEPCRIKIEHFQISLFGCINNHTTNLKLKDFYDKQKINISNIKCDKCKVKTKANSPNKEFYKCFSCNINLCLLCKSVHQSNHYIINYEQKNYICNKHNDSFIKYCLQCNKNVCYSCDDEHEGHKQILLSEIKPNIKEIRDNLNKIKKEIDIFNNNIKEIINKLNELNDLINIYYEINNNLLNNYVKKNRNYQILENIKQIDDIDELYNNLNIINTIPDIKDKSYNLIKLYDYINSNNKEILKNVFSNIKLNEMTIIYNIEKNKNKIKIFGSDFVKNNKNNCYILINGMKSELCESFNLTDKQKNNNKLEIKLIENKVITNMYSLFNDCNSLISLPDISNWNTTDVTIMKSMFRYCTSLESLPDISKWNTKNVKDMSYIFYECKALKSLPDISKWNTSNVTNMSSLFKNCDSIRELPDISKWNTSNVTNMSSMFYNVRLKSLPDISKWNTSNVTNMSYMFYYVILESLPDISKWNTSNVTDMSYMFCECKLLKSLPDISKWDIKNVNNMNSMFYNCRGLISLPDISHWEINKKLEKYSMFTGCNENIVPKIFK